MDERTLEKKLVDAYLTSQMVRDAYGMCMGIDPDLPSHILIPQLLGRSWFTFIESMLWIILKDYNNPTIDFKALKKESDNVVKKIYPDIFR